jgi:serine/threonine protein kinase
MYRIVRGIAEGMKSLASQGIVHRDLAARNVLLAGDLEPKISDFGFSRMVDSASEGGKTNSTVGPVKFV